MRRSAAEDALSLGVLGLGLAAAGLTATLSGEGGYAGIGPNFFPAVVSAGLVVLGVWLLVEARTGGWRHAVADDPAARGEHAFDVRAFAWVSAGLLAEIALMNAAGFVIAQAVLFVCVARGFGSLRPVRDVLIALVLAAALWAFFGGVLEVSLPAGALFALFR